MANKTVDQLTSSTPTVDDLTISYDNADTSELKKTTWQAVRDLFKTYFDTIYASLSGATFTGDINVPDEAYGAGWNGSTEVPTKNALYDKIETISGGWVSDGDKWDITVSSSGTVWTIDNGAVTEAKQTLSDNTTNNFSTTKHGYVPKGTNVGNFLKDDWTWASIPWGGDALTSNPLSQFASTTSAQLAGVISDETGSGVLVFWTDPTFTTRINVPEIKATSSSWIDVHNNSGTQVALFGAGWSTGSTLVGTTNVGSASADYHQLSGGTGTITNTATGSSSNININEVPKGTWRFQVGWVNVPTISSTDTLTNKDISSATNTYRSASDTATGAVELATAAETTTGTDATRAVTPDGLAGSEFGKRTVSVLLSGSASGDSALATGDGLAAVPVDTTLNGMNLVAIKAYVSTVSSSGAPLFQVRRSRRSSATARTTVDMLTTGVSIDASEFESADATTAAVINTSNDDVQTGDILLFDCDTAGTGTKGAQILLTFQLP